VVSSDAAALSGGLGLSQFNGEVIEFKLPHEVSADIKEGGLVMLEFGLKVGNVTARGIDAPGDIPTGGSDMNGSEEAPVCECTDDPSVAGRTGAHKCAADEAMLEISSGFGGGIVAGIMPV